MKRPVLADILTALLILLFSYTAVYKILDYDIAVMQMHRSPFPMMKPMAPVLGWLLPVLESMIVAGLLSARFRLSALYASVCLLLVFEFYIGTMLLSHSDLPCTCGGIISRLSWKGHLFFNAFFILAGTAAIIQSHPRPEKGKTIPDLSRA